MDKANIDKENMDKGIYTSPEIIELGFAKDIIKHIGVEGTGDVFPGVNHLLASQ